MVSTTTFKNAHTIVWRRAAQAGVALFLVASLQPAQPARADDDTARQESAATRAIRAQLERRRADQTEATHENQSRVNAAAELQKDIERLKIDLANAAKKLSTHQEAQKLAVTRESEAAKDVVALMIQLESHCVADALQLTADAALSRLEAHRAEIVESNDRLAGLHKESFTADQAARRAVQQADAAARQAEETQQKLSAANQAAGEADIALEEARAESIQASRALAQSQRMLNEAVLDVTRARVSGERLTNTATVIENSITVMRQAAEFLADSTEEHIAQLLTVLDGFTPLQALAEQIVEAKRVVVEERREQQLAAAEAVVTAESIRRVKAATQSVLSRKHFALQRQVVKLTASSQEHRKTGQEFTAMREQLGSVITQKQEKIAEQNVVADGLHGVWVGLQRQAEQAQEPLGRFVSFSRDIAPILARRCTACHNSRTIEGRLNMNSYAALLKGGESGAAVTPHDADGALLLTMVEDGSMPKDSDPLSSDEIETIRRWIDVGAPLDAGTTATADLFDIMPELPQPLPPPTYRVPIPVLATAFSPDGSLLATSGYHEVLLWRTDGGLVRRITNVAQRVNDVAFTTDGATLVVAAGTPGQLGEVKLFRVADGVHLGTPVRTTDSVYAVAVSPDGTRLAAGGADQRMVIVDLETQDILHTIEDHADSVMDVAWSPQSDRIASASYDKSCRVFDAATGEVRKTFGEHGEPVYTVAFLPDGETLVSGGADKKLRVWAVADDKQIREIEGFGDHVFRLAVTSDGRVYSAGADSQVREHQLSDGVLVRTMTGHTDWVYALAVDAQGKRLASGCYDGEVRLWNSTDGAMVSSFVAVPEQGTSAVTVSER